MNTSYVPAEMISITDMFLFGNIASLVLIGFFFFDIESVRGKLILLGILMLTFLLPAWKPVMGSDGFPTATVGFIVRIFLGLIGE